MIRRALIVLGLCGSVAYAQPVVPSWRPPSGCTSGQAIVFNGSIWTCGSAGVTNSAGANAIPKSDGTNLVASSWTDDGTNTTTTANIIGTNAAFGSSSTTTAKVYSVVTGSGTGLRADNTSSGKTSDSYGVRSIQTGSFDSTADIRRNYGVSAQAAASRSAGSNDVINFGVYTTASGGQVNYSLYGDAGTVALNVSSGNTCIGSTSCSSKLSVTGTTSISDNATIGGALVVNGSATLGDTPASDTHTINGVTTIAAGNSSAAASIGGTVLTIRQADNSNHYLTMQGTSNIGINFATPSSGERGTVRYSSGTDALRFGTAGTMRMNITNNGTIQLGDSSNTAVNNNVDILAIGNTGTGQTASTSLINATHTGSFSTAGGDITYYGGNIAVSATESAGTGTLTAVALRLSATNGDDPIGLLVDDGRVQLDGNLTVGGNTTLGNALTDTVDVVAVFAAQGSVKTSNVISPSAFSGTVSDWAPTGIADAVVVNISSSGDITLNGISAGLNPAGRHLWIRYTGAHSVTFKEQSGSNSSSTSRFNLRGVTDRTWTKGPTSGLEGCVIHFVHDGTEWVEVDGDPSQDALATCRGTVS